MRKILLSLLAVVSVLSLSAATSTLNFTAQCGGSGTADDGAAWTVTSDGSESAFDNTKGIHYGTGKAAVGYIELTTSAIQGTITSVVVNASTASGVSATAAVKVGNTEFECDGATTAALTTDATDYTFTGSASGAITVRVAKPNSATKALYVKSIVVTYGEGGDTPTPVVVAPVPVLDPASGTFTENFNVNVTWDKADEFDLYYTLDDVDMGSLTGGEQEVAIEGIGNHTLAVYTFDKATAKIVSATVTGEYTIVDPTALGEYVKLTDASELKEGDEVIFVYEEGGFTIPAGTTGSTRPEGVAITVINGTVAPTDATAIFTVGGNTGAFTFKEGDNFMNGPATGTNLNFSATQDGTWAVSITEGVTRIDGSNGRVLLFNTSSNQFGNYAGSNFNSYGKPALFVKAGQGVAVKTPTLSLAAGEYRGAQTVTIATETEGASLRYTLDGTDPLEEGATLVESNTTDVTLNPAAEAYVVRAIAVSEAGTSGEVTATYTIGYELPEAAEATEATEITASSFVANWTGNAAAYDLYVYKVTEGEGETVAFSENFDEADATLATFTEKGWAFGEKAYYEAEEEGASLRFGTGSVGGEATTPALGVIGDAVLTVDMKCYANSKDEGKYVDVTIEGEGTIEFVTEGEETAAKLTQAYQTFTYNLTGLNAASKVKFASRTATNNRFYLDNVQVVSGGATAELLEGYPIEVADNSCAVEGLEAETVYTYSVVAKNAAGEEAEASNIIEVTTLAGTPAIKGDINGDGSIDGNDVSALLEMVLAGGVSDAQKAVADINGDNSVDGNDVSALLEMVLAGE